MNLNTSTLPIQGGLPWAWFLLIMGAIFLLFWLKRIRDKRRRRGLEHEMNEAFGFDPRPGSGGAADTVAAIEEILGGVDTLASQISAELTEAGIPDVQPKPLSKIFEDLSPEMRRKLAIPLGIVAQGELVGLAKLQMELLQKVAMIKYRVVAKREKAVFEHEELTIHAKMFSKNVSVAIEGVLETQKVLSEAYAQLDGPMKALGQIVLVEIAKNYVEKLQASLGLSDTAARQMVTEVIKVIPPPEDMIYLSRQPTMGQSEEIEGEPVDWEDLQPLPRSNGHLRGEVPRPNGYSPS